MNATLCFLRVPFAAIAWLSVVSSSAFAAPHPVAHEEYGGYFVSNRFEPAAAASFVVAEDQASFDKVFGVAMVMGDKSHRLAPDVFGKNMVVAAIRRGKGMVEYQVKAVTADGGVLSVQYTTRVKPDANAEFSCPLILSVPKAGIRTVRFVENGKDVGRANVPSQAGFGSGSASCGGESDAGVVIECDKPGVVSATRAGDSAVWTIQREGIGRAVIRRGEGAWPKRPMLRIRLRGLESLTISSGGVEWKVSVLSHGAHETLLSVVRDGKEEKVTDSASPYWTTVRKTGADGKPVAGLPGDGGCFEVPVPEELLKQSKELRVSWIDFYR